MTGPDSTDGSERRITESLPAERFLAELRADRDRFAALGLLASEEHTAPIAACPGWDLATLVVHLGRIHRWAAEQVLLEPSATDTWFPSRPAADTPLIPWLVDGLDHLVELLASTDLDAPCLTFVGPRPRRWWLRRQTIETAVHRWDAQQACGVDVDDITGEVAAAGISEWCELAADGRYRLADDLAGSVHLHATDADGEWIIEVSSDTFTWREGHEKGDVAVRATRSDLLLIVSNRAPDERPEVFGDAALLDRVFAAAAF